MSNFDFGLQIAYLTLAIVLLAVAIVIYPTLTHRKKRK